MNKVCVSITEDSRRHIYTSACAGFGYIYTFHHILITFFGGPFEILARLLICVCVRFPSPMHMTRDWDTHVPISITMLIPHGIIEWSNDGSSLEEEEEGEEEKGTSRSSIVASEWGSATSGAPIMAESYLRDQTEPSYPPDAAADWRAAV